MEISVLTTLLLSTPLVIFILNKLFSTRTHNLPPGPSGLPLIGNAHQMDPLGLHKSFIKLGKTYGKIFKIQLLRDTVVVVNDAELLNEVLVTRSNEFGARQVSARIRCLNGTTDDIGFCPEMSKEWSTRKKLLVKNVRQFGEGLASLEQTSLLFIEKMIDNMKEEMEKGKSIYMKPILHKCTAAIISSIVYGEHFKDEDLDELLEIERPNMEALSAIGPTILIDMFPILRYLPIKAFKDFLKLGQTTQNWFQAKEIAMKEKGNLDDPSCMLEELYKYQKMNPTFRDTEIRGICGNAIFAGFITTSTSLYTLIGILASRPDVQDKLQQEIKIILGNNKPRLEDRSKMPYTEAVIFELLRYSSILPLLIPHAAALDTKLGGYDIPKGTMIMPNIWAVHLNEDYYEDPFNFKPERFLTSNGELVDAGHKCRRNMFAFGAGRRICAGELLAKNRMYLIVASLFQAFRFKPEDPKNPPNVDPRTYNWGIVLHPQKFNVVLEHI